MPVTVIAGGLGWPEGPTVLPDGRIVIVESSQSQLRDDGSGNATRFAHTSGAPNSCVLVGRRTLLLPKWRYLRALEGIRDDDTVHSPSARRRRGRNI